MQYSGTGGAAVQWHGDPRAGAPALQPPPALPPAERQRRERWRAFAAFDLDGTGAITQHDLQVTVQAYDAINELLDEQEITAAVRRCGMRPGELVTFPRFCALCDILEKNIAHRRMAEAEARKLRAEQERAEYARCREPSPRPSPDGSPQRLAPAAPPPAPQSPRACLGDPALGLGAVAHAFYMFDLDRSGAVSAIELPRMLAAVPKRSGTGTLRCPDAAKSAKAAEKWQQRVRGALDAVGKGMSDLLSLHDFEEVVVALDPPPAPPEPAPVSRQPTTASAVARRDAESERREREEEARRTAEQAAADADARNAASLIVKLEAGTYIRLEGCSADEPVEAVMRKVEEQTGTPVSQQRIVGRGFELDPRRPLAEYGIKVGHPHTHKGDVVEMRERGPGGGPQAAPIEGTVRVCRTGQTAVLQLSVRDTDPISALQQLIERHDGTPVVSQRLVFGGRELSALSTLRDYGVRVHPPGDVITLLHRDHHPAAVPGRSPQYR